MYSPKTGKQSAIDKFCNVRKKCRTAERNSQRTSLLQSDCLSRTSGHFWEPSKSSQPLNSFLASQTRLRVADRKVASRRRQAWRAGSGKREVRSLGRGWARSNLTRLPRPVSSWSATALAWMGPSSRVASSVSHHLPSLGRLLPAGGQVPRRLPGRHSSVAASPLRCRTGLSVGRRGSGRPKPWCPQGGLLPAGTKGHVGRVVGTATPLRGHRRPGPVRASAHLSQVLVGAGGTLPRASSVSASRIVQPQGRARSDKIRPRSRPSVFEADQTSGPRKSHAVGCCWWHKHTWTARGTAGRLRRLGGSGEDHPAGKYVPNARSPSGLPHPVPLANSVDAPLAARFCTVAPFRQWVQTHCP